MTIRINGWHWQRRAVVGLMAMSLNACVLVPGSHLSSPPVWFQDEPDPGYNVETDVKFVPITAQLIEVLGIDQPEPEVPPPELMEAVSNYQYRVGLGDTLNITVYEHPELTIPGGSFRGAEESGNQVYPDGTIYFPYAGKIEAVNKTLDEIRESLRERLSRVIEQPQVDVKVASFNSQKVYFSGEVNQPSILPITNTPLTLTDAVTRVGGLTPEADWRHVRLLRQGVSRTIDLRAVYKNGGWQGNLLLQHGDVLHVPRSDNERVIVMGEVVQPRSVAMGPDTLSLAQVIALTGGIDELQANGRGIFVMRDIGKRQTAGGDMLYEATVYQLNAASATAFLLADKFELQPRDIVYVTAAPIARWNRFLTNLLPSLTTAKTTQDIGE